MTTPIILSNVAALEQAINLRGEAIDKWLAHLNADPATNSIVEVPVKGSPTSSMYYMVPKSLLQGDNGKQMPPPDVMALCPHLLVYQPVRKAMSVPFLPRLYSRS